MNGYDLMSCVECRLTFVAPPPKTEELSAIYDSEEYYGVALDNPNRLQKDIYRRIEWIEKLTTLKGTILDIGCATGFFLQVAQSRGWTVKGIEQSAHLAEIAQQALGKSAVVSGELTSIDVGLGQFNVVCLWEVIEHNPNPHTIISSALKFLKPGGYLCLSTPNMSGWLAFLMKDKFPMIIPPEHLLYFTPQSLKLLITQHGGRVVRMTSFGDVMPDEISRGLQKLIPSVFSEQHIVLRAFSWVAHICSKPFIYLSNRFRFGIELEVYAQF